MCKLIKRLFCIGVLAAMVYLGVLFGRPYYKYYAFKSDAQDIIRFGDVRDEQQMRAYLIKRAKELGIPLKEENLKITRANDGYKAKVSWSETVKTYEYNKEKNKEKPENILKIERKFDFTFEVGD